MSTNPHRAFLDPKAFPVLLMLVVQTSSHPSRGIPVSQLCGSGGEEADPRSKSSAPWKYPLLELQPPRRGKERLLPGAAVAGLPMESLWDSRT